MAERKGQVYADKGAALVQLRWVLEASEHYPGNHGIYGSASSTREFIELRVEMVRWPCSQPLLLYSGRYLLLQKPKNCRLNQPG